MTQVTMVDIIISMAFVFILIIFLSSIIGDLRERVRILEKELKEIKEETK